MLMKHTASRSQCYVIYVVWSGQSISSVICVCDVCDMCSHTPSLIVDRAQWIFSSLASLTVRQLVPMAKAVILPVMMGVAR